MKRISKFSSLISPINETPIEEIDVTQQITADGEDCNRGEETLAKYKDIFMGKIFLNLISVEEVNKTYELYKLKFINEQSRIAFEYFKNLRISMILSDEYNTNL